MTAYDEHESFAENVADILRGEDISGLCGMRCVRFLYSKHGVRIKDKAATYAHLKSVVDIDHPYIDVMQIHRVDTLRRREVCGPIFVNFNCKHCSYESRFHDFYSANQITMRFKINYFQVEFLYCFGYFSKHGTLDEDRFCQAYN